MLNRDVHREDDILRGERMTREGRNGNLLPCRETRKMTLYCSAVGAWPLGQTEIYVGKRCLSTLGLEAFLF